MSPDAILDVLVRGEVVQHPLTIPEGFTVREIARAAERAGISSRAKLEALSRDPSILKVWNLQAASLEGYLFPETYHFPRQTTPEQVIKRMLQTFHKRFTPEIAAKARRNRLTIHQAVTLASIIEKETAIPGERALISAVYQNRLHRGMRLQADPTVLYALNRTSGPLSREDLQVDSPYNTYRVKGLPPGPIANPGLDSLLAVLNPAPSDYLYFVARGDGSHVFSKTLREHNQAVHQYRKSVNGGNGPSPN